MSDPQTTPDPFAGELSDAAWLRADARDRRRRGLLDEADRLERIADRLFPRTPRERKAAA